MTEKLWIAAAVLVLVVWLGRWDMQVVGAGDRAGMAYQMDRWTGSTYLVYNGGRIHLSEKSER